LRDEEKAFAIIFIRPNPPFFLPVRKKFVASFVRNGPLPIKPPSIRRDDEKQRPLESRDLHGFSEVVT
jgi:hypothetical protein